MSTPRKEILTALAAAESFIIRARDAAQLDHIFVAFEHVQRARGALDVVESTVLATSADQILAHTEDGISTEDIVEAAPVAEEPDVIGVTEFDPEEGGNSW